MLKSIGATISHLEDEIELAGNTVFIGRDKTVKVSPGGKGHKLSKLFNNLPFDTKQEISVLAVQDGFAADISASLRNYDEVFVEWRYIYESNAPKILGTDALFQIFNAIDSYCKNNLKQVRVSVANKIADIDEQRI